MLLWLMDEWYECNVCLRGGRMGVLGSRSIECMDESSLLSDCTSGLVGCLNTKLEDRDDDRDDGEDLVYPSDNSGKVTLFSNVNGAKWSRGGDVANHE